MVEASHGSPVAEKHLHPAVDHGSRICHPFAMPKQFITASDSLGALPVHESPRSHCLQIRFTFTKQPAQNFLSEGIRG